MREFELPGETNATLSLNNVQTSAAGRYSVVVGNSLGSDTNSMILSVTEIIKTVDSIDVNTTSGTATLAWPAIED